MIKRSPRKSLHKSAVVEDKLQATYRKTILPNQIRVVSEEIPHVRSVSVGVWVNAGSRDESPETNGISHLIEHMTFKGTTKRTVREIARSIESVGGYLNAFTSKEHTCYYARVLDEHTELALDVISDMILHPLFPEKELEKERGVIIEELKNAEDSPDDIIHDYFEKALFGQHSLGFSVIGTEKNLRTLSRKDLYDFHGDHYQPQNIVVAVAGNIAHDELVDLVRRYFSIEPRKGRASEKRVKPKLLKANKLTYSKPIQQAHVCLGRTTFGIDNSLRYPLMTLNTLLGDGMSSRLYQNIRERHGFAYSVYSYANLMSDAGTFAAYIGTDKAHIDRSIGLIFKEFEKLKRKKIGQPELERTKAQLKGSMMLSLESMPSRMMRLGSSELYFGKLISLDTVAREVDIVTSEQLHQLANNIFDPNKFSVIIFHPTQ